MMLFRIGHAARPSTFCDAVVLDRSRGVARLHFRKEWILKLDEGLLLSRQKKRIWLSCKEKESIDSTRFVPCEEKRGLSLEIASEYGRTWYWCKSNEQWECIWRIRWTHRQP